MSEKLSFKVTGTEAACLGLDDSARFPNLDLTSARKRGRYGWEYTLEGSREAIEELAKEAEDHAAMSGGEGFPPEDRTPANSLAMKARAALKEKN